MTREVIARPTGSATRRHHGREVIMLTFIIGLFIGAFLGVMCMALCVAARDDKDD